MRGIWRSKRARRCGSRPESTEKSYVRQLSLSDIRQAPQTGPNRFRPYCTDKADKGKLTSCRHRAHLALHPAKPRESRWFWRDSAGAFGCRSVVSHDRVAGAFRSTRGPDDSAVAIRRRRRARRTDARRTRDVRPIRGTFRCPRTGRSGDRPPRRALDRASARRRLAVADPARRGPPSRRLRRAA